MLNGQNRFAEAIEMLQGSRPPAPAAARPALAGIVQTYVRAGDLAGAQSHLEGVLAADAARRRCRG